MSERIFKKPGSFMNSLVVGSAINFASALAPSNGFTTMIDQCHALEFSEQK